MIQRSPTPAPRTVDLSDEHKAFLATMTDTEFRRWLYERIDFLACHIDARGSMVASRIVETMDVCSGLSMKASSRIDLARRYYETKAYQRLFAETEEGVA